MKNTVLRALTGATVLSALATTALQSTPAQADPSHHGYKYPNGINHRESHQEGRILQGVRSGSLTNKETNELQAREARLRAAEARDRADGKGLSTRERIRLQERENSISHDIYHQKHDSNHPYGINGRQSTQQDRILQGVRSGSLTNKETNKLEARESRLQQAEARDRVDGGRLTTRERINLQKRENSISHDIYKQKHDKKHR